MWAQRAARARVLARRYPPCRKILTFYAALADWQGSVTGPPEALLPGLLHLVRHLGPAVLREAAAKLDHLPALDAPAPLSFFGRAARQACLTGTRFDRESPRCPGCDQPPQAGCLTAQGEGLALELVCSLCFSRWPHPRSRCPACGETGEGRLVYYTTPEFEHIRVQACESCRTYFHLVDLTRDPEAIPETDELAAVPLDLWARGQGYHKLHPNLAGI